MKSGYCRNMSHCLNHGHVELKLKLYFCLFVCHIVGFHYLSDKTKMHHFDVENSITVVFHMDEKHPSHSIKLRIFCQFNKNSRCPWMVERGVILNKIAVINITQFLAMCQTVAFLKQIFQLLLHIL